jgi:hypothetical protein
MEGEMTDTQDNRRGARRLWLWPVAVLFSFPIGGYLADVVVDGVDSVGAALVGGLIAGLIIGAAEWFALRRWVSWLWIVATSIGMSAGLTAGAALVDYGISRGTCCSWVRSPASVWARSRPWCSQDLGYPARSGGRSRIHQAGHLAGW